MTQNPADDAGGQARLRDRIRQARQAFEAADRASLEAEARKQKIQAEGPAQVPLPAESDASREEGEATDKPRPRTIWGVTYFHTETGSEGGYWAVQDIEGIDVSRIGEPRSWSHYGLHTLATGDRLTIYAPESVRATSGGALAWEPEVLWEGEIRLAQHELFTEHAHGWWIRADQVGVERERWANFFFREHPCKVVTHQQQEVIGEQQLPADAKYEGLFFERPRKLYFMADGTVRWRSGEYPRLADGWRSAPRTLLEYVHAERTR